MWNVVCFSKRKQHASTLHPDGDHQPIRATIRRGGLVLSFVLTPHPPSTTTPPFRPPMEAVRRSLCTKLTVLFLFFIKMQLVELAGHKSDYVPGVLEKAWNHRKHGCQWKPNKFLICVWTNNTRVSWWSYVFHLGYPVCIYLAEYTRNWSVRNEGLRTIVGPRVCVHLLLFLTENFYRDRENL